MEQSIIYNLNARDFFEAIQKATKENSINNLIGFFPELVTSKTITDILKIHSNTLSRLIKSKQLIPINQDSSKYLFKLSDVLIYKLNSK